MENLGHLDRMIDMAMDEDLQKEGDITSESIFTGKEQTFKLISKDIGKLCGKDVFERVMTRTDISVSVRFLHNDGDNIEKGDLVAEVSGPVKSILKAERTALNFLSLMSAVATKTARFVSEAEGKTIILDTRKTIPGFRQLQKYAVRCGGGMNHRMGLHDMVLIKDNHIDAAGGISTAVSKVRERWGSRFKIEVEARNIQEVREALNCKVERILLDNMSNEQLSEAVKLTEQICETEASGNMTLERIRQVSLTGVDFISVGELTHSIKAFDFSLKENIK